MPFTAYLRFIQTENQSAWAKKILKFSWGELMQMLAYEDENEDKEIPKNSHAQDNNNLGDESQGIVDAEDIT